MNERTTECLIVNCHFGKEKSTATFVIFLVLVLNWTMNYSWFALWFDVHRIWCHGTAAIWRLPHHAGRQHQSV